MAIREHLEFDGSKFSGYIDFGENIACNDTVLANQILVFMIVCINAGWKIPITYYFIRSMSADKKSNLVIECLKAVHETGLKIVSLTCDGTVTNFSIFNNLGCNFNDVTSLQTSFPHPVTKMRKKLFFDPLPYVKIGSKHFRRYTTPH